MNRTDALERLKSQTALAQKHRLENIVLSYDTAHALLRHPHVLHVIGFLGTKTAYLDITREEAVARWEKANPEHSVAELEKIGGGYIYTIEFRDEFGVYEAWATP
jgi:hypothetical protein